MFRSNRGISAQLIDDDAGRTLAAVNWTEAELRGARARRPGPQRVGELLAERAKAAGSSRPSSTAAATSTTGACKALAEGAREGGLTF